MLLLNTHRILYISRNLGGADWCRNLGNKMVTYTSDNTYVQGESRFHVARMYSIFWGTRREVPK
jgi:hypothetical protein